MATLPLLLIFSVAFTGLTEGDGVLPDGPHDASVNGTFVFTTSQSPTQTPFASVVWSFGVTNIITSTAASNSSPPEYKDRITLFPSTGSLELRNLTEADSGPYSVNIIPTEGGALIGQTTLKVHEPVSNVTVDPKSADLVEFNDSVSLSCTSFGSPTSFLWLNDTSEVTASDRVQFTDGGSVMTIVNVTRFDQQQLRCRASNPVSDATSEPVPISVSFGPENTNLMLSPQEENFAVGSNIRLVCSAESRPDAQFMWFLDGDKLDHTERALSLTNIQMNQAGNYSCQTFNDKTLRYQTSQPAAISVMEKISGPSIKSSTNLTVEETRVDLTCEASGSIFTRTWKKDGSDLVLGGNMMLSDNNRLLSFNPVNRKDSGEYSCSISNPVSSGEAKYNMVVNYGPDDVQITGVKSLNVKSTLTLRCFAESTPSASYTWKLNGTTILTNSAEYIKKNVEFSDSGKYTCEATNTITERTLQAVHALTVTEGGPGPCPDGCIAGIVIACCVLIAGAVGGGYFMYRKKKHPKTSSKRNTSGQQGQDNTGYSSEELNYADVRFVKNKGGGKVQVDSQNDSSEYAQVRVNNGRPAAASPPNYDAHMQRVNRQANASDI